MKRALGTLLALVIAGAGYGCAPESMGRYNTASSEAEVVTLLNERRYEKAIWLLEQNNGAEPTGEAAYQLAQAYLGKAGFEPFTFAARLTEAEPDTDAAKRLFPQCPPGALKSHREAPAKCLLKRVYLRAPHPDDLDFAHARLLLRRAYPDPTLAPQWVNVLIGVVETVSLVGRVGDVYLFAKGVPPAFLLVKGQAKLPWLKAQGKAAREEGRQALARAKFGGAGVAKLLASSKAETWFNHIDNTATYAEDVGLPRFLDFVQENMLSARDQIKYADLIDRLRTLVGQEEDELSRVDEPAV